MRKIAVFFVMLAVQGCADEVTDIPPHSKMTLVVVDNCHTYSGDFSVTLNGQNLPILEPAEREGTVALCFWDDVPLAEIVAVEVSGDLVLQAELQRVPGEALVISAYPESGSAGAQFQNPDNLLYD